MYTTNDYLADRANPPNFIYVEDSSDWRAMWGVPDIAVKGLGESVSWYQEVDHALLLLAKDDRLQEAQQYIEERRTNFHTNPTEEEIRAVAVFLDPERLKGKIIVFDNETPGWLFGMDLIESILIASADLPQEDKPRVVSLMCSNPEVVEKNLPLLARWDESGVEVIHKDHYPFFTLWIGQVIKEKRGRFREWFRKQTEVDYGGRLGNLETIGQTLGIVTEYIRYDSEPTHQGIFTRITDEDIDQLLHRNSLKFNEVSVLLDQWSVSHPLQEQLSASPNLERK